MGVLTRVGRFCAVSRTTTVLMRHFVRRPPAPTTGQPPMTAGTDSSPFRDAVVRYLRSCPSGEVELGVLGKALPPAIRPRSPLLKVLRSHGDAFLLRREGSTVYVRLACQALGQAVDASSRSAGLNDQVRALAVDYLAKVAGGEALWQALNVALSWRGLKGNLFKAIKRQPNAFVCHKIHKTDQLVQLADPSLVHNPPSTLRESVLANLRWSGARELTVKELGEVVPRCLKPQKGLNAALLCERDLFSLRCEGSTTYVSLAPGAPKSLDTDGLVSPAATADLDWAAETENMGAQKRKRRDGAARDEPLTPLGTNGVNKRRRVVRECGEGFPTAGALAGQLDSSGCPGGVGGGRNKVLPPRKPRSAWAVSPRTPAQVELVSVLRQERAHGAPSINVVTGPAGTGKTTLAVQAAVDGLYSPESATRRIIITRPVVTAGEDLGALPGGIREKMDPYLRPMLDLLSEVSKAAATLLRWLCPICDA